MKLYYILIRTMRGIEIFQKPSYREISPMRERPMRDRPMRGPPVVVGSLALGNQG